MIAEENLSMGKIPIVSFSNNSIVLLINKLMRQTVPNFKSYLASDFYKKKNLNEDEFSQIYVEQAQILIRKCDYPFNISREYRDITNLSKGFSDLYFYPDEQGVSTASIFSVECKRLPSPEKSREKEYVIGDNNNGGIERYKREKHGKGLNECGLICFVEKQDSKYWLATINGWIIDLSKSDNTWDKNEILTELETEMNYSYLQSIANRKSDKLTLHHIWIKII